MTVTPERIAELIDQSFGDGPPPAPIEQHVRAGRRATRTARLRIGCGVAAAAIAVGAPVLVSSQHPDRPAQDSPPVADGRDTAPSQDAGTDEPFTWRSQDPVPQFTYPEDQAFIDVDGVLVIRHSASVVERRDDVWTAPGVRDSVALVTTDAGQEYWTFAYRLDNHDNAGSVSIRPAEAHGADLSRWMADEIARTSPDGGNPSYLSLGEDGVLSPLGTSTILDEVDSLPERLAPAGSPSAGALIAVGDAQLCSYVRRVGKREESVYLNASQFGPDLASCLQAFTAWDLDAEQQ